jgi:hypothetical protein
MTYMVKFLIFEYSRTIPNLAIQKKHQKFLHNVSKNNSYTAFVSHSFLQKI